MIYEVYKCLLNNNYETKNVMYNPLFLFFATLYNQVEENLKTLKRGKFTAFQLFNNICYLYSLSLS